jgi:hypothetical protein
VKAKFETGFSPARLEGLKTRRFHGYCMGQLDSNLYSPSPTSKTALSPSRHPHMLSRAMAASGVGVGEVPWRQRVLVTAASVNRGGSRGGGGGGGGGSISGRVEPSWLFFNHNRRQRLVLARSFGSLGGEGEGSAHQIAALVLWLRTHGVDFTHRAQFCRVRHMGVGGVATVDFNQGDVIFSLPLHGTLTPGAAAAEAGAEGADRQLRESVPLVMTTSLVTSHTGPLGALGRALSVAGLTTTQHVTASSSPSSSHRHGQDTRPRQHHQRPSHRLGGVQESGHDFPLNASHVSLLALGILHQSVLGGAVQVEPSLPIQALERRQVSTLEPMK